MKLVLCLVASFLGASGYFIRIPISKNVELMPDKNVWARNQRKILSVFQNICDEKSALSIEEHMKTNSPEDLSSESIIDINTLKESVIFLPKNEIFTELNDTHLNELRNVYRMLSNAKSFNAFYAVAAWLKDNVNCGLFTNAFYAALLHRNDTKQMMIPSPYEILPNYFIEKNAIIKGILLLSGDGDTVASDDYRFADNVYTLDANYTSDFYDNDQESKLSYFLEDVGLNTYYFMKHLEYAPWTYEQNSTRRNGVNTYHFLKQLLARYELERYANSFSEVRAINWDSLEVEDYDSKLIYSSGEEFSRRSIPPSDSDSEYRAYLKNIEDNIRSLVINLRESGHTKSEIIDHLMDILFTGDRSYEKVAIRILKPKNNKSPPPVFEHYMTKLRDPVYWQIMKKILDTIGTGISVFEEYTRDELYCPGVRVLSVEVKKAITYFDVVSIDVTDALKSNQTKTDARLMIQQPMLNHKDFSVKLNISSQIVQKVLIKMFLSPNYRSDDITSNSKRNYMQLYSFETHLKSGSNAITVSLGQMNYFQDFMSIQNLLQKVENVDYGIDEANLRNINYYTEFPSHLILPKGTLTGLSVKLLVFVAPIFKFKPGSTSLELNTAVLSPGYPFDSMINQDVLNNLPNAKFKEILVTHKGIKKAPNYYGTDKKWSANNSYNFSSSATYDYASKKGPYDYNSKKDLYLKNKYSSQFNDVNTKVTNDDNILQVEPIQVTETDHKNNSENEINKRNENFIPETTSHVIK